MATSAIFSLTVVPIVHEIAVVSASVPETATIGNVVSINATVANYGSVSEAFELRAYADTLQVSEQAVPKLAPGANYTGQMKWNTTGYHPGTYTIRVSIPPVPGELNTLDNDRDAGNMLLTQTPGSGPSPSPGASGGNAQSFAYGRQLAIVAGIAEALVVFLVVLRTKAKRSTGNAAGPRKG